MSTINPYLKYAIERGVSFKGLENKPTSEEQYFVAEPAIITPDEEKALVKKYGKDSVSNANIVVSTSPSKEPTSNTGFGGFINKNEYNSDEWIRVSAKTFNSVSSIYIPKDLDTDNDCLKVFGKVALLADSYAIQNGIELMMSLSGFTDINNFKFESKKFYWNGEAKRVYVIANDGLFNIITD